MKDRADPEGFKNPQGPGDRDRICHRFYAAAEFIFQFADSDTLLILSIKSKKV